MAKKKRKHAHKRKSRFMQFGVEFENTLIGCKSSKEGESAELKTIVEFLLNNHK